MGMIAAYMMIDEETLDSLMDLDSEELEKKLFEIETEGKFDLMDIDKIWDVLHYFLTGVSASEPIEGDKLSEAVVGVHNFNIEDEEASFITCTENDELPEIIEALKSVKFDELTEKFDLEELKTKNLYPQGIEETEKTRLIKEIKSAFDEILLFYQKALSSKHHVIVSIL